MSIIEWANYETEWEFERYLLQLWYFELFKSVWIMSNTRKGWCWCDKFSFIWLLNIFGLVWKLFAHLDLMRKMANEICFYFAVASILVIAKIQRMFSDDKILYGVFLESDTAVFSLKEKNIGCCSTAVLKLPLFQHTGQKNWKLMIIDQFKKKSNKRLFSRIFCYLETGYFRYYVFQSAVHENLNGILIIFVIFGKFIHFNSPNQYLPISNFLRNFWILL